MELKDYIDVLYSRKWIVVGTLSVILAVALLVSFAQAPTYQSSVDILVDKQSSSEALLGSIGGLSETDRFILNSAEIIKTDAMAQRVESQLQYEIDQGSLDEGSLIPDDVPGPKQLKSMLSIRLAGKTGIFSIVVVGKDRVLTAEVARVYADEYMANRQLAAIKQISDARKEVWNQITEIEEQIHRIAQEAKQYEKGELPTDLAAAAQQSASLWSTLYQQYINLRISESLEQRGLEIIETASLGKKVGPKTARNGTLALFLGLILGIGLAFFVDYMDNTLRSREDFERYYETSIVGEIPYIPEEELEEFHVVYFDKPKHQAAEGFRTLRTNLQFLGLQGNAILVTSSLPEEGKSTVAASLGAALSEMGHRVLLVDGDLRKPTMHKMFGLADARGVSAVLSGACTPEEAIEPSDFENLYLLPSGVRPPNPGKMVASDGMRLMLEKLRPHFDYVLVDSPPVTAASDSSSLAHVVDGVLLVGRIQVADRDNARRTVDMLKKVEANILGLVINCIETGKRYGYYRYQYYYYYDAEGKDGGHRKKKLLRGKSGARKTSAEEEKTEA